MTAEAIITDLIRCLDYQMATDAAIEGNYKNDLFKLFREAHKDRHFDDTAHPRLTADGLREILLDRWYPAATPKGEERMKKVLAMWHEWCYAWRDL